MEEINYLTKLLVDLDKLETNLWPAVVESPDGPLAGDVRNRLLHLSRTPDAPATLAVVDKYREILVRHCGDFTSNGYEICAAAIDDLRLELARLYAARGSYPPTPIP